MYLDCIFGQKLCGLNDKHTIWCRTSKIFVCPFGKFQTKAVYQRLDYCIIDSKAVFFVCYFDHVYGALGQAGLPLINIP